MEGYHLAVNYGNKDKLPRFSLQGIVKLLNATDRRFYDRARRQATLFRSTVTHEANMVPALRQFPVPVQKLIAKEIYKGKAMWEEGDRPREDCYVGPDTITIGEDVAYCGCPFFRKWNLPCKDILFHHFQQTLPSTIWDRLAQLWEESGFEIYFATDRVAAVIQHNGEEQKAIEARQEARQLEEMLRAHSFAAERQAFQLLAPENALQYLSWRNSRLNDVLYHALKGEVTVSNWSTETNTPLLPQNEPLRPLQF